MAPTPRSRGICAPRSERSPSRCTTRRRVRSPTRWQSCSRSVRVLLVLDAFGSQNLKQSWADSLREAGVEVGLLRQLHWYSLHNASDRSHVRVVVVDGEIAYTGGFGLADYWLCLLYT